MLFLNNMTEKAVALHQLMSEEYFSMVWPHFVFLVVVMVLGVPGNALVIAVFFKIQRKKKYNSIQLLVLALAFTDLTVCSFLIPFDLKKLLYYYSTQEEALCDIFEYIRHLAMSLSCVLAVMAVERFRAVCSLTHMASEGRRGTVAIIVAILIFCCLLSAPAIIFIGVEMRDIPPGLIQKFSARTQELYWARDQNVSIYTCEFLDEFDHTLGLRIFGCTSLLVFLSLIVTTVISYGKIYQKIRVTHHSLNLAMRSNKVGPLHPAPSKAGRQHSKDSAGRPTGSSAEGIFTVDTPSTVTTGATKVWSNGDERKVRLAQKKIIPDTSKFAGRNKLDVTRFPARDVRHISANSSDITTSETKTNDVKTSDVQQISSSSCSRVSDVKPNDFQQRSARSCVQLSDVEQGDVHRISASRCAQKTDVKPLTPEKHGALHTGAEQLSVSKDDSALEISAQNVSNMNTEGDIHRHVLKSPPGSQRYKPNRHSALSFSANNDNARIVRDARCEQQVFQKRISHNNEGDNEDTFDVVEEDTACQQKRDFRKNSEHRYGFTRQKQRYTSSKATYNIFIVSKRPYSLIKSADAEHLGTSKKDRRQKIKGSILKPPGNECGSFNPESPIPLSAQLRGEQYGTVRVKTHRWTVQEHGSNGTNGDEGKSTDATTRSTNCASRLAFSAEETDSTTLNFKHRSEPTSLDRKDRHNFLPRDVPSHVPNGSRAGSTEDSPVLPDGFARITRVKSGSSDNNITAAVNTTNEMTTPDATASATGIISVTFADDIHHKKQTTNTSVPETGGFCKDNQTPALGKPAIFEKSNSVSYASAVESCQKLRTRGSCKHTSSRVLTEPSRSQNISKSPLTTGHNGVPLQPSTSEPHTLRFTKQIRVAKLLLMVTGVFLLSYMPFWVLTFIYMVEPHLDWKEGSVGTVFISLFYQSYFLNNAANPFLYAIYSPEFRKESWHLLCQLKRKLFQSRL